MVGDSRDRRSIRVGVASSISVVSRVDFVNCWLILWSLGLCIVLHGTKVSPLDKSWVSVSVRVLEERLVMYFCLSTKWCALLSRDLLYAFLYLSIFSLTRVGSCVTFYDYLFEGNWASPERQQWWLPGVRGAARWRVHLLWVWLDGILSHQEAQETCYDGRLVHQRDL